MKSMQARQYHSSLKVPRSPLSKVPLLPPPRCLPKGLLSELPPETQGDAILSANSAIQAFKQLSGSEIQDAPPCVGLNRDWRSSPNSSREAALPILDTVVQDKVDSGSFAVGDRTCSAEEDHAASLFLTSK